MSECLILLTVECYTRRKYNYGFEPSLPAEIDTRTIPLSAAGVEAVHVTVPSVDTRSPSSGTMTSSVAARSSARVSKQ